MADDEIMNSVAVAVGVADNDNDNDNDDDSLWSKFRSFIENLRRQAAPPSADMMEKQELGKAVFMLAVPMSTGLVFFKSDTLSPTAVNFSLVANVAGCAAIWNALLLRKTCCSRFATVVEQAGVGSVFLGFNMLVGNYLPPELRFVPAICWVFSMLPFVMAGIPGQHGTKEEKEEEEDDVCPV